MARSWNSDPSLSAQTILDLLHRLTNVHFTEYTKIYDAESNSYIAYCKLDNAILSFPLPQNLNHFDTSIAAYISREIRLKYPELYI